MSPKLLTSGVAREERVVCSVQCIPFTSIADFFDSPEVVGYYLFVTDSNVSLFCSLCCFISVILPYYYTEESMRLKQWHWHHAGGGPPTRSTQAWASYTRPYSRSNPRVPVSHQNAHATCPTQLPPRLCPQTVRRSMQSIFRDVRST